MQTASFTCPFRIWKYMPFFVQFSYSRNFKRWDVFSSGEELFKYIFILHRCNAGGTPFPLCPIGCSSNYPLGKRRLGEQPYYFSSSVITCRNVLFTAQEFLREVQADAYRMTLHHDSSTCTSASSPNLIHMRGWLCFTFFPPLNWRIQVSVIKLCILWWKGLRYGALA